MMSVNISKDDIYDYISSKSISKELVHISCFNSPLNSTISGAEDIINKIKLKIDEDGIFCQKLKTGVSYHSPFMESIIGDYLALMGHLEPGHTASSTIVMVSSVTGTIIRSATLSTAQYWIDNMTYPVDFATAIDFILRSSPNLGTQKMLDFIEIGPHSTLRRPVLDTCGDTRDIRYHSVLNKLKLPEDTLLNLLGQLWIHGYPVSIDAGNQLERNGSVPILSNCPEYPFDHSQSHWTESRLSRDYRLRNPVDSAVLGFRANDWNPFEPR
jgi:acyl transferase domain-containing protein